MAKFGGDEKEVVLSGSRAQTEAALRAQPLGPRQAADCVTDAAEGEARETSLLAENQRDTGLRIPPVLENIYGGTPSLAQVFRNRVAESIGAFIGQPLGVTL